MQPVIRAPPFLLPECVIMPAVAVRCQYINVCSLFFYRRVQIIYRLNRSAHQFIKTELSGFANKTSRHLKRFCATVYKLRLSLLPLSALLVACQSSTDGKPRPTLTLIPGCSLLFGRQAWPRARPTRLQIAWDYPRPETWCLARPTYNIFHSVYQLCTHALSK